MLSRCFSMNSCLYILSLFTCGSASDTIADGPTLWNTWVLHTIHRLEVVMFISRRRSSSHQYRSSHHATSIASGSQASCHSYESCKAPISSLFHGVITPDVWEHQGRPGLITSPGSPHCLRNVDLIQRVYCISCIRLSRTFYSKALKGIGASESIWPDPCQCGSGVLAATFQRHPRWLLIRNPILPPYSSE